MPCERAEVFARVGVPEADGMVLLITTTPKPSVPTPTSDSSPVRAVGDAVDIRRMPCECLQVFARVGVPEADGIVPTPTSDSSPVRAEGDAVDPRRMPCECLQVFARAGVPEADFLPTPTSASEGAPVRAEGDAVDPRSVCPVSVCRCSPVSASQRRTVPPQLPLAIVRPSG